MKRKRKRIDRYDWRTNKGKAFRAILQLTLLRSSLQSWFKNTIEAIDATINSVPFQGKRKKEKG